MVLSNQEFEKLALKRKKKRTLNLTKTGSKSVVTYEQILEKPKANLKQSTSKPETKLKTNLRQSTDKLETKPKTNLRQSTDKLKTSAMHESHKLRTEPKTKLKTNLRQSTDKLETKPKFSRLTGLQKKLLLLFFDACQINGSKDTSEITIESLSTRLETPSSSIQKTIQRLEKKGFIFRKDFKNGRGGWTIYSLPTTIYQQVLEYETQDKLRTNLRQSADKLKSEPKTEPKTTPPSSSSSDLLIKKLIKKNTTTTTLLDEGLGIDIPDNLKEIGFGASQISHVFNNARNPLTPPRTTRLTRCFFL